MLMKLKLWGFWLACAYSKYTKICIVNFISRILYAYVKKNHLNYIISSSISAWSYNLVFFLRQSHIAQAGAGLTQLLTLLLQAVACGFDVILMWVLLGLLLGSWDCSSVCRMKKKGQSLQIRIFDDLECFQKLPGCWTTILYFSPNELLFLQAPLLFLMS